MPMNRNCFNSLLYGLYNRKSSSTRTELNGSRTLSRNQGPSEPIRPDSKRIKLFCTSCKNPFCVKCIQKRTPLNWMFSVEGMARSKNLDFEYTFPQFVQMSLTESVGKERSEILEPNQETGAFWELELHIIWHLGTVCKWVLHHLNWTLNLMVGWNRDWKRFEPLAPWFYWTVNIPKQYQVINLVTCDKEKKQYHWKIIQSFCKQSTLQYLKV